MWIGLFGYLVLLGVATLSPVDAVPGYDAVNLRPGDSIYRQVIDPINSVQVRAGYFLGNLLLFAPLVIFLRGWFRWPPLAVLATATVGSMAIEVTQYAMRQGRVADVDDVVLNVGGAALVLVIVDLVRAARGSADQPAPECERTERFSPPE